MDKHRNTDSEPSVAPSPSDETPGAKSDAPLKELMQSNQGSVGAGSVATMGGIDESWRTHPGHALFTLAGFSFLLFEFIFLSLYFDGTLWFGIDLSLWGLPTILLLLVVGHFLLTLIESDRMCDLLSIIWHGKPPICYRKWLRLDDSGITYGVKHIRWDVIESLELSWFGNLIVRSRVICGDEQDKPDVIFKFPYAPGDQIHKNKLIAIMSEKKSSIQLNARLEKSVNSPIVKGQSMLQLVSSSIMVLVLFDVGFSSFYYLELLKNYYVAGLAAMCANKQIYNVAIEEHTKAESNPLVAAAQQRSDKENMEIAHKAFERAEYMTSHPFALSWVSSKFLHASNVAAGIHQERSNVMWLLGQKDKAIDEARKALEEQPKNLRMELRLARLLAENGQKDKSYEQLKTIFEDHPSSLLPRLYLLAMTRETATAAEMKKAYHEQLDECYATTFGIEPWWPPGGDRFFTELWFSKDERFLLDRFFQVDSRPFSREPVSEKRQPGDSSGASGAKSTD